MEFSHLKDTKFPNLSNVDVYKFKNTFDYSRWQAGTKIRLVNVLWESSYSDVVKFATNEERDLWFDSLDDYYDLELGSDQRIIPDNSVKLPVPYDIMARFNYLYIEVPIATSINAPIDYENDTGVRRWYFFINSISYLAPNTTQAFIQLDVWTQFINDMNIKYMMLERGHAPVAYSDTDEYLANPLAENRYLMAPDINYDNTSVVRSGKYIPVGNGRKVLCMASTCLPSQMWALGQVFDNDIYVDTVPTFSDIDTRNGYQLQVNNYGVGDGRDYTLANTPTNNGAASNHRYPNNTTIYSVPASEVYGDGTFFSDMMYICPQFLNTLVACFVVDESMVNFGESYIVAGHTLRVCNGAENTIDVDFTLQKSDFNYPSRYERFAKLYTSPYATIELTNNNGKTISVNIEDTGNVTAKCITSVAFPFIDCRVYFDGIGGVGSSSYAWVDLLSNTNNMQMPNSDWFKYCFDMQIPTFALYMDGETAYNLANFNRATRLGRENSLASYHNAVRDANTAYENLIAESDIAHANAYDSADTDKANADRSANTGKANADANADTIVANTANNTATRSANTALAIANATANTTSGNNVAAFTNTENNGKIAYDTAQANNLMFYTTQSNAQVTAATTANSNMSLLGGAIANGIAGGITTGGASGDVLAGVAVGIASIASATAQAATAADNAIIITQAAQTVTDATIDKNRNTSANTQSVNTYITNYNATAATNQTNNNNTSASGQTANTNSNETSNASNTSATIKGNATRTQTTSKTNATASQTTAKGNSDRTKNVRQANSFYTRDTAVENAKETLLAAKRNAQYSLRDARNQAPRELCAASGDMKPDYFETKGVQYKIRTQNDSAICMTGDTFARYGYALNQVWDMSTGFTLMKNFTYWKANDVWVDDVFASNSDAQREISAILTKGVTVWSDGTKIGRVSIYDN